MAKKAKSQRGESTPGRYLSEAQLKKLLRYVKNKADLARQRGTTRAIVDELIILVLVNTGVRASELRNLNIAELPVNHGENALWVRDAKGNVGRKIDISSQILNYLERFVRLYRKGAKPDEPLLVSERGNRLSYMSLYSKVRNIGEKAEIGKLHPHILRRTYLVRLYEAEQDLRFVQEQAGHASRKTTARYARTGSDSKRQVKTTDDGDSSAGTSMDDSLKGTKQISTCEGCGRTIFEEAGTKIDSGQILCSDCLKYFCNR
ncbi:MAG: tyrosine-type recombinase/integrase [Planctomycetota bacterium]|jgi:integrase